MGNLSYKMYLLINDTQLSHFGLIEELRINFT